MQDNSINFVDVEFPPGKAALIPVASSTGAGAGADAGDVAHITWRRPAEFFPPEAGKPLYVPLHTPAMTPRPFESMLPHGCVVPAVPCSMLLLRLTWERSWRVQSVVAMHSKIVLKEGRGALPCQAYRVCLAMLCF